ncbi:CARDB domain-containing protein [Chloroflexota bacterium]
MQKSKWSKILIPLFLLLLIVPAVACSQPSTAPKDLQQAGQPAEFNVGPVSFAPSTVMVGDVVTVAATVTNTGDVSGTYTAALSINGQEADKKDITIGPGASKEASFQLTETTTGSYNLAIGSSTTTLTVYEWNPYTIQYDDSQGVPVGVYVKGEEGHIVHFTPPAKAFKVQKIKMFGTAKVSNTSEFDDNVITVRIWDKEGNNQLWSQDFPWRLFFGAYWQEVAVPDIRVDDDFLVEIVTHSEPEGDPIGFAQIAPGTPEVIAGDDSDVLRILEAIGGDVKSVIVIGFDYPQAFADSPLERPETRSGYSLMGKVIDPVTGMLKGLRWLIRVEGEGAPGS